MMEMILSLSSLTLSLSRDDVCGSPFLVFSKNVVEYSTSCSNPSIVSLISVLLNGSCWLEAATCKALVPKPKVTESNSHHIESRGARLGSFQVRLTKALVNCY